MAAPGPDERAHWAALKTAIAAKVGPKPGTTETRVFQYGEVPGLHGRDGVIPDLFVLVSIQRRSVQPAKSSRRGDTSGWRVTVLCAARTVDETEWAGLKVTEALEDACLSVSGNTSTPLVFESGRAIGPDGTRFSGVSVWTYAL